MTDQPQKVRIELTEREAVAVSAVLNMAPATDWKALRKMANSGATRRAYWKIRRELAKEKP